MATHPLLERLNSNRALLLDGATGTELSRRGVPTKLPLWSTHALLEATSTLYEIHRDYVDAGADVVTANTFRTYRRNLATAGLGDDAARLTQRAVELARNAADRRAFVAGSQPPLEDCYSPELTPDDDALAAEHGEMSANLAAAGVDLILCETHHTIREAVAAVRAASATGLPVFVSFVCGADGRLLSGETISAAAATVATFKPSAMLVNCAPAPNILPMLRELQTGIAGVPIGAYANIGVADPIDGWRNTDAESPYRYSEYASSWLKEGAWIVGGCCGTTPEHVRELRQVIEAVVD